MNKKMSLAANLDKKCRICAADIFDVGNGIFIFSDMYLEEKIRKYLYITVTENDGLPSIICASCYIKLEQFHKFASLALKTEENYLTYLSRIKYNEEINNDSDEHKQQQQLQQPPQLQLQRNSNKAQQKKNIKNYKNILRPPKTKIRNTRHVDHITLEQIINDKIAKNFRTQQQQQQQQQYEQQQLTIQQQNTIKNEISIVAYDDLKLGQFIKDHELLRLILKALKWDEKKTSITDTQMERLKNTSFRDLLTNSNLLKDGDLLQLIKSYVGPESLKNIHNSVSISNVNDLNIFSPIVYENNETNYLKTELVDNDEYNDDNTAIDLRLIYNGDESITQMEVGVDPELFFPYDDESNNFCKETTDDLSDDCDDKLVIAEQIKPDDSEEDVNAFPCTICQEKFISNQKLQEHIVTHLMKHQNSDSSDGKQIVKITKISNRGRKRNSKLKTLKNKFECLICNKKLSTKGNLKVHMETHKPKGKYTCEKCGRIFKSLMNLLRHKEYHSEVQFSCNICKKIYPSTSTLKTHLVTHSNSRNYNCTFLNCDKTFKRNQDLKFHINQHTGKRPYKCLYCTKEFASSGNCFSHRKRMHPLEIEQEATS